MADLIFRLEMVDGTGPYRASSKFTEAGTNRQDYCMHDRHPSPIWEDSIDFKYGQIFGFTSLALARRWWFDADDLRDWHKEGLRLAVWPASASDDIRQGTKQSAFTRPKIDPLYLPAYAIHEFDEVTIRDMVTDKFKSQAGGDI